MHSLKLGKYLSEPTQQKYLPAIRKNLLEEKPRRGREKGQEDMEEKKKPHGTS